LKTLLLQINRLPSRGQTEKLATMAGGNTPRVIQVTNIAPQATKDQMQTLFGNIGKIEEIRLYPTIREPKRKLGIKGT